jgi:hypothetical protein
LSSKERICTVHFFQIKKSTHPSLPSSHPPIIHLKTAANTTASTGQVHAIRSDLPSSNTNIRPRPISTAAASTLNIDIRRRALNRSLNIIQDKLANSNTVGWVACSSVISLVDENSVVGDARECDLLVGHAGHGPGVAGDGLDSDAVLRGLDLVVGEEDGLDCVIGAATDGTYGEVSLGNLEERHFLLPIERP